MDPSSQERCLALYFSKDKGDNRLFADRILHSRADVLAMFRAWEKIRQSAVRLVGSCGDDRKVRVHVVAVGNWWTPREDGVVSPDFLQDPRVRLIVPQELAADERFDHLRRDGNCFALRP